MNWIELQSLSTLEDIRSSNQPVLIFKHSTRCSISVMAKGRLERSWNIDSSVLPAYHLDLLSHRDISAKIAEMFSVHHESPQVLMIHNGECIYDASHQDIQFEEITEQLGNLKTA